MEQNIQEPKKTTILIEDLYKSYGEKEVLLGLNLEVHEGELFGFIGRNGIGKSTLVRVGEIPEMNHSYYWVI